MRRNTQNRKRLIFQTLALGCALLIFMKVGDWLNKNKQNSGIEMPAIDMRGNSVVVKKKNITKTSGRLIEKLDLKNGYEININIQDSINNLWHNEFIVYLKGTLDENESYNYEVVDFLDFGMIGPLPKNAQANWTKEYWFQEKDQVAGINDSLHLKLRGAESDFFIINSPGKVKYVSNNYSGLNKTSDEIITYNCGHLYLKNDLINFMHGALLIDPKLKYDFDALWESKEFGGHVSNCKVMRPYSLSDFIVSE